MWVTYRVVNNKLNHRITNLENLVVQYASFVELRGCSVVFQYHIYDLWE